MADRHVRIIVGASLDRDATSVFAPLQTAAARARKTIAAETKAAGSETSKNIRKGVDPAEKAFKDLEKWAKEAQRDIDRETKAAGAALAKNVAKGAREASREMERMASDAERATRRMIKAADASERKRGRALAHQGREREAAVRGGIAGAQRLAGMGYGAARTAVGFGARVAGDVARGAGADLDFASQVSKSTNLQTQTTDIANSGYMAGQSGPNGQRQDATDIAKQLTKEATETGFAVNEAAEGLAKFTAKTGDLDTGRQIFKDLAVLSRATGTHLEDMVDAAGDVSNQLGDIPNKAEVINKVMRQIAGEGKLGAVEIKDLASQMAKVAAAAARFEGGAAENIGVMGMLAQEARQRGGAASATQAATSVGAFTNTFTKGARLKAFRSYGVEVQGKSGQTRDAREIIIDALRSASSAQHGGMGAMNENMGHMFADVRARTATLGFESVYRSAGGGEAGIEAVRAEMKRLQDVALEQAEIAESFSRSMKTSEAQANAFNNQLEGAASELKESFTPALLSLAPIVVGVATDISAALSKFFGTKDRVDANKADAVAKDVHGDTKLTNRSIALGEISPEQIKKNRADALKAQESMVDTSVDAANGKANMYGKKATMALKAFDYTPLGVSLGYATGHQFGHEAVDRDKSEQAKREDVAKQAAKVAEEARDNIANVYNYIQGGTLKVHVVKDDTERKSPKAPPQSPAAVPAGDPQ